MRGSSYENAGHLQICEGDIDYRGIVQHINDGVLIIREGTIVFANEVSATIVMRDRYAILGQPFTSLIAPADQQRVLQHCMKKLYTPELSDRIEFTIPRTPEDAVVEMTLTVIDCGGAPSILAAMTDITERRKTRQELQKVKDRLESILHSMNDVVVSISPTDYSIIAINPAAEALYGIPRRAFTAGAGQLLHFVHPEDREQVRAYYEGLAEEEFDEMEYRIISSTGKIKWVHDDGHLAYCRATNIRRVDHVIRDITEQKEALDALKRSEEKYRDFFQSTKDMAYSVAPDGTFLDINDAGLQMLGFTSREEALSSNLKRFYVKPSERIDLLAEINEVGFIADKHVRFQLKDDKSIEVAITARAKLDDAGYLLHYEGIAHNITQALEDQRNRVLRNAAGGLCHYLNTHLMHIVNAKDGIKDEVEALEDIARHAIDPHHATEWLATSASLQSYCEGLDQAYRKIIAVTQAFNSAFLTYREEAYLDKAILDIFNSCLSNPGACAAVSNSDEALPGPSTR